MSSLAPSRHLRSEGFLVSFLFVLTGILLGLIAFDFTTAQGPAAPDLLLNPSGGNVGIGTATPQDTLDVSGAIRAEQLCDETGANCKDISGGWTGGGNGDGHSLDAVDGAPTDVVFVDNSGNVGIGTTTPQSLVQISQTSGILNPYNLQVDESRPGYTGGWLAKSMTLSFNDNLLTSIGMFGNATDGEPDFNYFFINANPNEMDSEDVFTSPDLVITPTGRVGIGTTAPTETLDVAGNITSSGTICDGNGNCLDTINSAGSSNSLNAADGDPMDAVFVNNVGDVGIGTTTPQSQLHLYAANGGSQLRLANDFDTAGDTSDIAFGAANGYDWAKIGSIAEGAGDIGLTFHTTTEGSALISERMRINHAGNVGIGTDMPAEKLDVNGTVKATEFVGDGSGLTNLPTECHEKTRYVSLRSSNDNDSPQVSISASETVEWLFYTTRASSSSRQNAPPQSFEFHFVDSEFDWSWRLGESNDLSIDLGSRPKVFKGPITFWIENVTNSTFPIAIATYRITEECP